MFALTPSRHRLFALVTWGYFLLPISIFLFHWIALPLSIPLDILLVAGGCFIFREEQGAALPSLQISRKNLAATCGILFAWCYFSGIGGFSFQNIDHHFRNAVLYDLVNHPWPVIYHEDGKNVLLVYYFTYWLPSALMGKAFGMEAANVFLLVWSFLGLLLFIYHAWVYLKNTSIIIPLALVFFSSGCDIVPYLYLNKSYHFTDHIEWWGPFQYSSMTTCLYWVFNQAIPLWIGALVALNCRSLFSKIFVGAIIFPFGPFGSIGLLIYFCLLYGLEMANAGKSAFLEACGIKTGLWQKIGIVAIACLLVFVFAMFFGATGRNAGVFFLGGSHAVVAKPTLLLKFILCDFLIMALFIVALTKRRRIPLHAAWISLLLIPVVQIISPGDYVMRVSIPAILILGIYACGIFIDGLGGASPWLKRSFVLFFLICAVTPLSEINRSVVQTILWPLRGKSLLANGIVSFSNPKALFRDTVLFDNFRSTKFEGSFYWKYLRP